MQPKHLNWLRRIAVLSINGLIAAGLIMSYVQVRTAQLHDLSRRTPPDELGVLEYVYIAIPLVAIVLEFLSTRASWIFSVGWLVLAGVGVSSGLVLALVGFNGFREPEHWFAAVVTMALPALVFASVIHFLFRAVKRAETAA